VNKTSVLALIPLSPILKPIKLNNMTSAQGSVPKASDIQSYMHEEPTQEKETLAVAAKKPAEYSIDPENEVTGVKLFLIHIGICLCTFLIGLVKFPPGMLRGNRNAEVEDRTST